MNYQQTLQDTLDKSKKVSDQAEVFITESLSHKVETANQAIESQDTIMEIGLSIRLIKNHKIGFAYTSELETESIQSAIGQALHNALSSEADEFVDFPEKEHYTFENSQYFDPNIKSLVPAQRVEMAIKIEKAAFAADHRISMTEKSSYHDNQTSVYLANSKGLNANYVANSIGGWANVIAQENNQLETGFGVEFCSKLKEFNPEKIGIEAAKEAVSLLNGKAIPTQKIPVIFPPVTACHLLQAIAPLFSAEAIQKGRSLLAGKMQHPIAAKKVTIIDHGNLPNSPLSAPFDGEGIKTKDNILIENGRLINFLYDSRTAKKDKTKSTGNSSRFSFKAPPSISPTNFHIKPGDAPAESIIRKIDKGIIILRLMGLHTVNPISGEFSLGAAGVLIENGIKTDAVRGITISGNIVELLASILEIGSDLRFIASDANYGSPTLLVEGLSISGEHA